MPGFQSSDCKTQCFHDEAFSSDIEGPEPIAIVGIGCRLPGDVSSAAECWSFLQAGRDARGEFPKSRFDIDGFYSSKKGTPGTLPMRGGYFLNQDIRNFDNSFFGINNLEATHMDPQQRNLLEVVYECLESAGARLEDLAGSNTGCYVGDFVYDFLVMQSKDDESYHRYSPTGKGRTILSNRVSHAFDLRGPSMTLDTACSSSLYCLHVACRALLQGDCDAAIVASANLIQTPEQQMDVAASGVLSATSTCHTFDASADGYGRADAIGALYLKPLSAALRDNDPIRSVIRATSTNSNGQTPGITLPSAKCQEAVIRKAYDFARLNPRETDYFECHGTGTPVGDPIEVSAVAQFQASGALPGDQHKLLIGSTKPSFGHSEAASGITSIIKATLALEHLEIPATVGIRNLNPTIPWSQYGVEVAMRNTSWPRTGRFHIPRVSINSFGYGGANAHCILDNAQAWIDRLSKSNKPFAYLESRNKVFQELDDEQAFVLPFSARNPASLRSLLDSFVQLQISPDDLPNLVYTLANRRSKFEYRTSVVLNHSSWSTCLQAAISDTFAHTVKPSTVPLTFIFTGQGAQWPEMGKRLFDAYSVFRNSILRSEYHLLSLPNSPSWSLSETILEKTGDSIHQPLRSQTACTAIQIALVDLLKSWNILPTSVIGHSSGEIAASYAASHISATYAIEIAYLRGQAVSTNQRPGSMMAVSLNYNDAQDLINAHGLANQVCIACHNSPENLTLSGDNQAIDLLQTVLQESGRFARKLKTGGQAYHSHHMKKLGASYESMLQDALYREKSDSSFFPKQIQSSSRQSDVRMISTVLGRPVTSDDTSKPAYWRANLESPVLFSEAVQTLVHEEPQTFIELGPHHAMQMPVHQIENSVRKSSEKSTYLSPLVRNKCSETTALNLIGKLWQSGYDIDFEEVHRGYRWNIRSQPRVLHNLPNYAWNHSEILWKEPRRSLEYRGRRFPRDELIGSIIPGANGRTSTWRGLLDVANVPWLADHKLGTNIVLPGACYISMASRACQQLLPPDHEFKALDFRNVEIDKVMLLKPETRIEIFTELRPVRLTTLDDYAYAWEFIVSSVENERSVRHASGRVDAISTTAVPPMPQVISSGNLEKQGKRLWYAQFAEKSLNFGPAFQSLHTLSVPRSRDGMVAAADLETLPGEYMNEFNHLYPFDVHPIITDAAFQTGLIATAQGKLDQLTGRVPVSIERLRIFPQAEQNYLSGLQTQASAKIVGPGSAVGQCELLDNQGRTLLHVHNIKVAPLQETDILSTIRSPMLKTAWTVDISKINQHNKQSLSKVLLQESPIQVKGHIAHLAGMIMLKAKLNPDLNVLYLSNARKSLASSVISAVGDEPFGASVQYCIGLSQEHGEILYLDIVDAKVPEASEITTRGATLGQSMQFDVVVLEDTSIPHMVNHKTILKHLNADGTILSLAAPVEDDASDSGIFIDDLSFHSEKEFGSTSDDFAPSSELCAFELPADAGGEHITIASTRTNHAAVYGQKILIVAEEFSHPLNVALTQNLPACDLQISTVTFQGLKMDDILSHNVILVTAELEKSIVANASPKEFESIQLLAAHATKVVWLSGGGLISSKDPERCAILGLSRSIMAGNPAIRFMIVDIDNPHSNIASTVANVQTLISTIYESGTDLEYLQKDGILNVSRLVTATACNECFEQKKMATAQLIKLSAAPNCELQIRNPGQFDSLEFQQICLPDNLPSDDVEVHVKAVGMNAKDLYTLSGKVDTIENTCSCEFSGIITRVGAGVKNFNIGDRIVSSSPGRYRPYERVPAAVCYKIKDEEDFTEMASVPMVFGTAIHALRNLAKLQAGESVLIHSAAGGVGTAAILLAQRIGAEIYATVGNDKKKAYLVDQYGLNPDHIFNSRDTSFLPAILEATNNNGVDVVLNSLTGSRLHASLDACAKFGRFIEIGKRDILDAGNLNMRTFSKGITFSAFDLHELFYSSNVKHRAIYEQLLIDAVELYRSIGYTASATTSFDISDISSAFRYFANASRIGKVAITYNDPSSLVPFVPQKFSTQFSANKSYLLIGCLGGLGRSISRYMIQNGARNFTFLGRSGASKPAAAMLVADLEQAGATVTVITGDVCNQADVEKAVSSLSKPLGGVVQAAMGLSEALFPVMTHTAWHTALDPKIRGTWNIHTAISEHEKELEFFLLTSSIAGTIGFSTEANYCAANCFLDHFASYRRAQGLKATSVALGPVAGAGIVHENPEIENVFFRGGITEVSEDDMLCVIDIALSKQDEIGHVITGLEPSRAKAGFEDSWEMLAPDPRLRHITSAHRRARASATADGVSANSNGSTIDKRIGAALKDSADADSIVTILHTVLAEQLGKLVLMEPDKIGAEMYLTDVGMDSTLAAQFRTYVFRATGVDVSFVMLMDAKSRMVDLVDVVKEGLTGADGKQ